MPKVHRGGPPRPHRRPRPHHFDIAARQKKMKIRKTHPNSGRGRPRKNPESDPGQSSTPSAAPELSVNYDVAKCGLMDTTGQSIPFAVHVIETDVPGFKYSVIPRPALRRLGWRDFPYPMGARWTRLVLDGGLGAGQIMMNMITSSPLEEDVGRDEIFLSRTAFAMVFQNAPIAPQALPGPPANESQTPATYVE